MSDEGRTDGNIGDLVMKLDSLDDFFEDSLQSPGSDGRSSRTVTEAGFAAEGFESGAQLYDEQTLPILHQSLARTFSSVSFQNGFADMRPAPLSRDGLSNAMNPGAFNIPSTSNSGPNSRPNSRPGSRPGMHSRSVTSPSAPASFQSSITTYTSDEDYPEEVFSDGDDERNNNTSEGGSFFLENMIKPLAQGTRSGMRRLTGGRSRDNDRMRDGLRAERRGLSQPPRSPRVPKVPQAYLKTFSPGGQDQT